MLTFAFWWFKINVMIKLVSNGASVVDSNLGAYFYKIVKVDVIWLITND